MDNYNYMIADVFTSTPLAGNPLAVFLDATGLSTERMQKIAEEMRLSETVFVFPPKADGDVYVRIFTPVNELPFAGHPTLGTAIVLGTIHTGDHLRMETAMGTVPFNLERTQNGTVHAATMQQPIPTWAPYKRAEELLEGLGLTDSTLPIEIYCNGPRHVYVGLASLADLSQLTPDHRILARLPDMAANCFAGSGALWSMRMFSPAYGVVEDAATGSAAGPLAIHLARHGLIPFGQTIDIQQGAEIGRPSTMQAIAHGNHDRIDTVAVSGSAVIIAKGVMFV